MSLFAVVPIYVSRHLPGRRYIIPLDLISRLPEPAGRTINGLALSTNLITYDILDLDDISVDYLNDLNLFVASKVVDFLIYGIELPRNHKLLNWALDF